MTSLLSKDSCTSLIKKGLGNFLFRRRLTVRGPLQRRKNSSEKEFVNNEKYSCKNAFKALILRHTSRTAVTHRAPFTSHTRHYVTMIIPSIIFRAPHLFHTLYARSRRLRSYACFHGRRSLPVHGMESHTTLGCQDAFTRQCTPPRISTFV